MDSRKQNPTVSWGISLHAPPLPPSVFVCRVQWSVYQSIHLPLVLPTLIHQPTLYCLISLSANLPSRICLTFPLSALSCQSVSPKGTVRTWMHLNADISVFFTQPGEIKQVMTPDLPLKIKKKRCLHHVRWCTWRRYWGDVGHSGILTTWHFVLTVQS